METVLKEHRLFSAPKAFVDSASISDPEQYRRIWDSAQNAPVEFWETAAEKHLTWHRRWDQPLEWNPPFARWFLGGQLNASFNCLDRHLPEKANQNAILWEGEDGTQVQWTYAKLHSEVCRLANTLQNQLHLKAGDTVAIYMPLVPEAVVAMLACARLGVVHSVIFAGFASHAIRDRVQDAECKAVLTADVGYRKGQKLGLASIVETAVAECPTVKAVLCLQRESSANLPLGWVNWEHACKKESSDHTAQPFDSEHPLFLLYTSGTTGRPKGILHTTGGYMTGVATTTQWVFDLKPNDVYWCTADIGWVTGHSYVVYGPLSQGATLLLYEGVLVYPHCGRIWELIERYKVSILYTAPTAIRSFMREGDEVPGKFDLSSLRLLGSVGEPINPEAWMWYHRVVGHERCPIVDTWWQTETGSILVSGVPGVVPQKPGSASRPFPGIVAAVVDEAGRLCQPGTGGYLVIKHPWPSMLRGIYKDPERFKETYFSRFAGFYFTGDGAQIDEDGYVWIKGRVDDVLNVSGHRLGTMEIESALVSHPRVAEAAVVGRADGLKGQAVVAYVIPRGDTTGLQTAPLIKELKDHVAKEIGALARPDDIFLTCTLPKTRSGKIMRRLLRDLADGKTSGGDVTTLENPGLLDLIQT